MSRLSTPLASAVAVSLLAGCAPSVAPAEPAAPMTASPVETPTPASAAPRVATVPATLDGREHLAERRLTVLSAELIGRTFAAAARVVVADEATFEQGLELAARRGAPLLVVDRPSPARLLEGHTPPVDVRALLSVPVGEFVVTPGTYVTVKNEPGSGGQDVATVPQGAAIAVLEDDPAAPLVELAARAAGFVSVLIDGEGDVRRSDEAVAAIKSVAGQVLLTASSVGWVPDETFWSRVERVNDVAATLPGGGIVSLPGRLYIAMYGHPSSGSLGVLGEQPPAEAWDRLEVLAGQYAPHTDLPVVPTFEVITTVASASAGTDGDYSAETRSSLIEPYVQIAGERGGYVVLDFQSGRTDFLTQVKKYQDLLIHPHVGVALDPEWRLKPGEMHMRQIGSVSAAEVNATLDWLEAFVAEHNLPNKQVVLHQFRHSMLPDRHLINTDREHVDVLVHMDGQGPQTTKDSTYRAITRIGDSINFYGWKQFYDEDRPGPRAPKLTLQLDPFPWFISYQ